MAIPKSFSDLLPKRAVETDDRPTYYLWVFDPEHDKVHLADNEGKHRAYTETHLDLAKKVVHPDRVHGYAYKIKGGWRITDWDHKAVKDPHILWAVTYELAGKKRTSRANNGDVDRTHYSV